MSLSTWHKMHWSWLHFRIATSCIIITFNFDLNSSNLGTIWKSILSFQQLFCMLCKSSQERTKYSPLPPPPFYRDKCQEGTSVHHTHVERQQETSSPQGVGRGHIRGTHSTNMVLASLVLMTWLIAKKISEADREEINELGFHILSSFAVPLWFCKGSEWHTTDWHS